MAEARQAVAFQFSVTEEGKLKLNYSLEGIKLLVQTVLYSWRQRYVQLRNSLLVGVFPASPISLLIITSLLITCSYSGNYDLIGWFDYHVSAIPGSGILGSILRWTVLLLFTSFSLWLVLAYLLQQLLKLLLMYRGFMFEEHGQVSLSTIIWQFCVRIVASQVVGKPTLYSYQRSLPRLPLPSLKATCHRYLRSVKSLLSKQEYQEMEQLVEEFKANSGRKFQWYLWLKSLWVNNYVTDWWDQYVYLAGRGSIMINSNYYATDARILFTKRPAARLGLVTYALLRLHKQIKTESLRPLMGQGLIPLCSNQYRNLFGTTRIPGKEMDNLLHTDTSSHLAVYHKGCWYRLATTYRNKSLTSRELEQQFQYILDDDHNFLPGEDQIMALTTQKRDKWADHRETFFSTGTNKSALSIIETALYVVVFEDLEDIALPAGVDSEKMSAYCKDLLCGRGWNRWFDKSFCVVSYPSGYIGMNAEHSWADAPIVGYMMEFCSGIEHNIKYKDDGHCFGQSSDTLPPPNRLEWEIGEECVTVINEAKKLAVEKIVDVDLYLMEHMSFGKGLIKKLKISPDAFLQMALQLAYYKDAGRHCLTYEASMTRLYREGRTETVRSATVESSAFVKAMCDDSYSNEDRRKLLLTATTSHQKLYRFAMIGKGIDRHLFCLYVMSRYFNEESPFLKKVLGEPWRLSTSQTPTGQLGKISYNDHPERITSGGGFGPVAPDGYGVSYIIPGDYVLYFHVSSFKSSSKTDSSRFANHIAESLEEMKNLFEAQP